MEYKLREDVVTQSELAMQLGLSPTRFRQRVRAGLIPKPTYCDQKRKYYTLADVERIKGQQQ